MNNTRGHILNERVSYLFFVMAFAIMLARVFLYLGAMPLVHAFCLAGKLALVPIAVLLAVRSPGKPNAVDAGMLVYGAAIVICCLLNHTQLLTFTLLALDVFIFWALCRWFFVRRSLFPLQAVTAILAVFIVLNFLLVLRHPEGLWHYAVNGKMYYLLGGNYNNMGKAMFAGLLSNYLLIREQEADDSRRRAYTILFWVMALVSIATLLLMGSMTSLVGIMLLIAFFVVPTRRLQRWALAVFVPVYIAVQTWAVFINQDKTSMPKAEYFVEHVLHKDMTFSLRTRVWKRTKQLIERRPMIGYGEQKDDWYQTEVEGLTTHNLVLHILLKGGWVSMAAFLLFMLVTHVYLLRRLSIYDKSPQMKSNGLVLLSALWVFLFMQIFEVYTFACFAIIFIYIGYLPSLGAGVNSK